MELQRLLEIEKQAVVLNHQPCQCDLCNAMTPAEEGVIIKSCAHSFCKKCVQTRFLEVKPATAFCPYPYGRFECEGVLTDREIEFVLGQNEYQQFIERRLKAIKEMHLDRSIAPDQLQLLETFTDANLAPNVEPFCCPICFDLCEAMEGVTLQECFHAFCKTCLVNSVKYSEADVPVVCPAREKDVPCNSVIQDREMKSLLDDDWYNKYLERCLEKAEHSARNAFHCKTPNCNGWILIDGNITLFVCPVCYGWNCMSCKAMHTNMSCEDYKDTTPGNDIERSERAIQTMIQSRVAMRCPHCTIVVTKMGGCLHMVCGKCKQNFDWTGIQS